MAARTSWAMLGMPMSEQRRDEPDARPIRVDPNSDLAKRISARHAPPEMTRLRHAG